MYSNTKNTKNGDMISSMFPYTRNGKLSAYKTERRWIGLNKGWTRIGKGTTEMDARHSSSQAAEGYEETPEEEASSVKALIAQLCEHYFRLGWSTGTAGGVSIRVGGPSENRPFRVFVAPSGIQKEDMIGDDVFELDMDCNVVEPPITPNLRLSACTPLWYLVYKHRPSARCVIHTHSINSQMATLMDPTESATVFTVTHLEMLKGVGNHAYDDVLEVPILDNRPSEDLLSDQFERAITNYPKCNAVLVRRHGIFCWGDSWEQAKTQLESFDSLFESAVRMKQMGIDPSKPPQNGSFRVDNDNGSNNVAAAPPQRIIKQEIPTNGSSSIPTNGKKIDDDDNGFRGMSKSSNQYDVSSNKVPMLPRNGKILLLDIEGCTTSIAFVKEKLFPYVTKKIDSYVSLLQDYELSKIKSSLLEDISKLSNTHSCKSLRLNGNIQNDIVTIVKAMVKHDVKATGLKSLQGQMWKSGYENGTIKGHVYNDFLHVLNWCELQNIHVYIYSSGSVEAQKLLFGNSIKGDLTKHFKGHYDTKIGGKKEAASYTKIARDIGVHPSAITFVSDAEAELVAARHAGIGNVIMSIREGNAPLTPVGKDFPFVHSLLQLCGI